MEQTAEIASGQRDAISWSEVAIGAAVGAIGGPGLGAARGAAAKAGGEIARSSVKGVAKEGINDTRSNVGNNPFGAPGKPDHQAKVQDILDNFAGQAKPGEQVLGGKGVYSEGKYIGRNADAQIRDQNGNTRLIGEAERNPGSKRDLDRERQYANEGIPNQTFGVGNGEGKGKSDVPTPGNRDTTPDVAPPSP